MRRSGSRVLVSITALGLGLRVLWWWYAQPDPVSDFEYTRRLAETVMTHHQYGFPGSAGGRVPAYPLFLAALMTISRSVAWLSLASVVLASALVPLMARFAASLGLGRSASLGVALVGAVNPGFVFFSPVLATEHLFILLLVLALTIVVHPRVTTPLASNGRIAVGGFVFGLAALARVDALFYLPVLALAVWWRTRRVVAVAVLVAALAAALAPWFIRNRIVIGPGAGLSTTGGPNFYYAHNDRAYGWHPLKGTPLEGLSQLDMHRRGYELGFEYLSRASLRQIAGDIWTGTTRLYGPAASSYGLYWSTRQAGPTPDDFQTKPLAGLSILQWLADAYVLLLSGAILSLVFLHAWPLRAAALSYGIVVLNWIAHCWIFWADPRFRLTAEVVFCVLTAFAAAQIVARVRRRPADRGAPS